MMCLVFRMLKDQCGWKKVAKLHTLLRTSAFFSTTTIFLLYQATVSDVPKPVPKLSVSNVIIFLKKGIAFMKLFSPHFFVAFSFSLFCLSLLRGYIRSKPVI